MQPNKVPRIQPGDVLSELFAGLELEAASLCFGDGERLQQWRSSATALLARVPCPLQRVSWAHCLAVQINHICLPNEIIIGDLLRGARDMERGNT